MAWFLGEQPTLPGLNGIEFKHCKKKYNPVIKEKNYILFFLIYGLEIFLRRKHFYYRARVTIVNTQMHNLFVHGQIPLQFT